MPYPRYAGIVRATARNVGKEDSVDRIECRERDEGPCVVFCDYKDERQLKDYYKLFKKASGYLVLEYRESAGSILAITNNEANSIRISWEKDRGCGICSDRADAKDLVAIVYKMLCYRYSGYSAFAGMLAGEGGLDALEEEKAGERKHPVEQGSDSDITRDIEALLALLGGSQT